jgi:predicted NUDIX family NTP pyrophosphohydrolase
MTAAGKQSAGLLMYRQTSDGLEVLLAHPGGPFFRNKDEGAWTIPKGAPGDGEALVDAALREFAEEVGLPVAGPLLALGEIRQKGGKVVHAWAAAGDMPAGFSPHSNLVDMEWPPRSGRRISFPEVDRVQFLSPARARAKINPAQVPLIDRLEAMLAADQGATAKQ